MFCFERNEKLCKKSRAIHMECLHGPWSSTQKRWPVRKYGEQENRLDQTILISNVLNNEPILACEPFLELLRTRSALRKENVRTKLLAQIIVIEKIFEGRSAVFP